MAKETLVQWNTRRSQKLAALKSQGEILYAAGLVKRTAKANLAKTNDYTKPADIRRWKQTIKDSGKKVKEVEKAIAKLVKEIDKINKQKPTS